MATAHERGRLGFFLCWAVVFADIGTSVYYTPGILYSQVGTLAGFFVTLTLVVFILLTLKYAEVTYRYPQGGGVVTVASSAMGPWMGALGGMFILVDYFLTAAISSLSGLTYFAVVFPLSNPLILLITLAVLILLGVLNWWGVSESALVSLTGARSLIISGVDPPELLHARVEQSLVSHLRQTPLESTRRKRQCLNEGKALMAGALLTNPLRAGVRRERTPEPCALVIFGATGDLTRRKLLPALYNLVLETPMPAGLSVVGVARRPMTNEQWRQYAKDAINTFSRSRPVNPAVWESFSQGLFYHQTEFHDLAGYECLGELLHLLDYQRGTNGNRLFYLATSPEYYPDIIERLGKAKLAQKEERQHPVVSSSGPGQGSYQGRGSRNSHDGDEFAGGWTRLVIEKPFGHDLESARELNRKLLQVFSEDQVYRIDHYLGKETVQNILVFRFSNGIFEPIWNRRYIDNVQITAAEQVGIEGRAGYYETTGALRDMVQNHMLQLLMLTSMEPPVSFEANAVRDEKVKVLHAIPRLDPIQVGRYTVRAHYGPGWIAGQWVSGYTQEPGVSPTSKTETYVALKLEVDNWRWAGVPFYLRTGKHLAKRVTEIDIEFKRPPFMLFKHTGVTELQPNILSLRIQPDEGISLRFGAKVPGSVMQIRPVTMVFRYGSTFAGEAPEAYERLLLDCMLGDSTLFTRCDEAEAAWEIITGILEGWAAQQVSQLPAYEAGSWGPEEAVVLLERDGRKWRLS